MQKLVLFSCLFILFNIVQIFAQKMEKGTLNGANYNIHIPDNWNKGLVLYAHGYESIGEGQEEEEEEEEEGPDEFVQIFTQRGFAYAASDFNKQGLIIKDGVEDTEALRNYFVEKYGQPALTIITGHSMGGMITIATIEKYPDHYDGALPLCGWLAPVASLLKNGLDMLVTFDYLFGKNDGAIITGAFIPEATILELLKKDLEKAALFAAQFDLRVEDLPAMIAFNQFVTKEVTGMFGGLAVGNSQTIYSGFGNEDKGINKSVKRYAADPKAAAYYNELTPKGAISDPVLALHTTYDEILPVSNYEYYDMATMLNGTQDLYFQQYIVRDGHCFFKPEETGAAFDTLLEWIKEGKRPQHSFD